MQLAPFLILAAGVCFVAQVGAENNTSDGTMMTSINPTGTPSSTSNLTSNNFPASSTNWNNNSMSTNLMDSGSSDNNSTISNLMDSGSSDNNSTESGSANSDLMSSGSSNNNLMSSGSSNNNLMSQNSGSTNNNLMNQNSGSPNNNLMTSGSTVNNSTNNNVVNSGSSDNNLMTSGSSNNSKQPKIIQMKCDTTYLPLSDADMIMMKNNGTLPENQKKASTEPSQVACASAGADKPGAMCDITKCPSQSSPTSSNCLEVTFTNDQMSTVSSTPVASAQCDAGYMLNSQQSGNGPSGQSDKPSYLCFGKEKIFSCTGEIQNPIQCSACVSFDDPALNTP